MSFGVKNGLPTYQSAITKSFHKYIDEFLKIFLDDFNNMSIHLTKLKKMFFKM